MSINSQNICSRIRIAAASKNQKAYQHKAEYCPFLHIALSLEKDPGGLEVEIPYLDSLGIKGTYMKNLKRVATKNRVLTYKCYFTHDYNMPFLMSYFDIDPKPKDYIHPNGVKGISKVVYRTDKKIPCR